MEGNDAAVSNSSSSSTSSRAGSVGSLCGDGLPLGMLGSLDLLKLELELALELLPASCRLYGQGFSLGRPGSRSHFGKVGSDLKLLAWLEIALFEELVSSRERDPAGKWLT